jgi:Uma2 family endonuclease
MSTIQAPSEQRFILDEVSWRGYSRFLRAFADRPGVRLTFDHGILEIMTLSFAHESWGHLLGRLVVALTEELGLPVAGGGSATFRRQRKQRGLEADECYWIASEPQVRGKNKIDLRRNPPPDLALEIDITHSSLDRLSIYAALGVHEVWRLQRRAVTIHVLEAEGTYRTQAHSLNFPSLAAADLTRFLSLRGQMDENALVRQFRTWVRRQFGVGK